MGNKGKISVTTQLEDTKSLADAEAKDRAALLTKFKMLSTDLENLREKLENEELVDVLQTKVANAEKSKARLGSDLDDISMEYERIHAAALITEKRAKNFDKVLGEWLSKANDVQAEVAASKDEGRNYSSELFRLKAAQDEATE